MKLASSGASGVGSPWITWLKMSLTSGCQNGSRPDSMCQARQASAHWSLR